MNSSRVQTLNKAIHISVNAKGLAKKKKKKKKKKYESNSSPLSYN